jgi:hypothetical protein
MNPSRDDAIFLLGSQRSGTTLLRLMLDRHPNLAVPHEPKFVMAFYPRLAQYGDLSNRANVARLLDDIAEYPAVRDGKLISSKEAILSHPIATYPELVHAIMREYTARVGKRRWIDKTPFYTPHIDTLWRLIPDCKIIHLVRDGRDVALSLRSLDWGSKNIPRLAQDWRWKTTICHKVGSVIGPERFLEVRYEELVERPEATLRSICGFLGEEFSETMLDHGGDGTKEKVPEGSQQWHTHSTQPPDRTKLYGWKQKLSVADQTIFEQEAGDALDLFGYERTNRPGSWRSSIKRVYYSTIVRW